MLLLSIAGTQLHCFGYIKFDEVDPGPDPDLQEKSSRRGKTKSGSDLRDKKLDLTFKKKCILIGPSTKKTRIRI